ncbi:hypothetical protein H6F75_00190 [Nodosilinea sp. FACHB-131]|uniref:hypothetical protein n=1 Tax=Cyanophyceae TaxID=3028117 RepID=UPI0016891355|nr:hypothetical protein [Nodosilinea sp. FACHB-131]MBD1871889.1 hypothetical protein [Nodosilinea sp. FACHB-131]
MLISTLAFFGFALPYLMLLNAEGKLLEGIGLLLSGASFFLPLAFQIHDKKQAELEKSEKTGDEIGLQLMNNVITLALANQEAILRQSNQLGIHQRLRATELGPAFINDSIPPILADRADRLLSQSYGIAEQIDFRRGIAQHLEQHEEDLKALAVEAADDVLDQLSEARLKALALYDLDARNPFIGDIFKYLRVWLKSSIEYDMSMPEDRITQNALDRKLYLDVIKHIRDHKIEAFGLADEAQKKVVRKYLTILVERLDAA